VISTFAVQRSGPTRDQGCGETQMRAVVIRAAACAATEAGWPLSRELGQVVLSA